MENCGNCERNGAAGGGGDTFSKNLSSRCLHRAHGPRISRGRRLYGMLLLGLCRGLRACKSKDTRGCVAGVSRRTCDKSRLALTARTVPHAAFSSVHRIQSKSRKRSRKTAHALPEFRVYGRCPRCARSRRRPSLCAKSRVMVATYTPPVCRNPVGLGAKRVTTAPAARERIGIQPLPVVGLWKIRRRKERVCEGLVHPFEPEKC